jgi:hypothetical protein
MNVTDAFSETNPIPAAGYNANGDSGILGGGGACTLMRAFLICSSRSGTNPTLDVVVEDTPDGTNFFSCGAFTQVTAAGSQALDITKAFSSRWRVRYTIGGTNTPTFNFGIWVIQK